MKAFKNVLTIYIKLCYVYVKFKWANQSCSLQKLTNQSMLNGKQLFYWKLEKFWSFDKARNVLIKKNRDENIFY